MLDHKQLLSHLLSKIFCNIGQLLELLSDDEASFDRIGKDLLGDLGLKLSMIVATSTAVTPTLDFHDDSKTVLSLKAYSAASSGHRERDCLMNEPYALTACLGTRLL